MLGVCKKYKKNLCKKWEGVLTRVFNYVLLWEEKVKSGKKWEVKKSW